MAKFFFFWFWWYENRAFWLYLTSPLLMDGNFDTYYQITPRPTQLYMLSNNIDCPFSHVITSAVIFLLFLKAKEKVILFFICMSFVTRKVEHNFWFTEHLDFFIYDSCHLPNFLVIFLFYKSSLYIMDISSSLNILQRFLSVCHSCIIFSSIKKLLLFNWVNSVDLFSYSFSLRHK